MAEDVLVPSVVGVLVQHPAAALHLDGVAAAEVSAQVRRVAGTLVASPLKVLVLEKHNLGKPKTNEVTWVTMATTHTKISCALELQPSETLQQVLLLTFPIVNKGSPLRPRLRCSGLYQSAECADDRKLLSS